MRMRVKRARRRCGGGSGKRLPIYFVLHIAYALIFIRVLTVLAPVEAEMAQTVFFLLLPELLYYCSAMPTL